MEINLNNFIPSKVLKVYKSPADGYYIEIHNVYKYKQKEQYHLGSGMPLTRNTMRKLMSSTLSADTSQYEDIKIFDKGILYCVHEEYKRVIVWWRPARKIYMHFSQTLTDGEIWMPPMLFIVKNDDLMIFAMKQNSRPKLNTMLYNAPLLNNISENKMCWGSANIKLKASSDVNTEIQAWENRLWMSRFAHAGNLKATKTTDIIKLYKDLLKTKRKFPVSELVSANKTYVNAF